MNYRTVVAILHLAAVLGRQRPTSLLYKSDMTNTPAATIQSASGNAAIQISAVERRQRWRELCLVLVVAFGSFIMHSVYLLIYGPNAVPQPSSVQWAAGIVQEATALLVLGYVLSRRGLKFASLGFRWSLRDVGVGLLVTVVSYVGYALGSTGIQIIHRLIYGSFAISPSATMFFSHPSFLFIPFSLFNPFFEELIARAYLMSEVMELTGSRALAVTLSVAVQFSYHLYYGWFGAVSVSFFFLVLALYYARSRRALPVIVAHTLNDVYALSRLW